MDLNKRQLGNTGIEVGAIGLGAMPLSLAGHPDESVAFSVIKYFIEHGGNFIDTANVYCSGQYDVGHNEALIQWALNKLNRSDEVYIATKGGLRRTSNDWLVDASPEWLRASCEKSLKALKRNSIFLYQLHAPDSKIPLMESIGELVRLQEQGMIEHIGVSNVNMEQLQQILKQINLLSLQNRCNLFQKADLDNGLVDYCRQQGIVYIAHSPVGGHYHHKQSMQHPLLQEMAAEHGASSYGIALAWLLHKAENLLPIPGASRVSSIRDSLMASSLTLSGAELAKLDQLTQ